MAAPRTVTSLIRDVTSMIDEENRASVDIDDDILPALNRAVNHAAEILARYYAYPLLSSKEITPTAGVSSYTIPEDALASRFLFAEVNVNGFYSEIKEVPYNQVAYYESPGQAATPAAYTIIGNQYRFVPTPSANFKFRVWYAKRPEQLVRPAGRISLINTANNYVILDDIDPDVGLTPQVDSLKSFVSVIDAQTGEIKGNLQILSIDDARVNFRTTIDPTNQTVWNKEITGDLSSIPIEKNDYLCLIEGTCVPPVSILQHYNFLVQYATAEIRRKLGDGPEMEENVLQKFEEQMKSQWSGRNESTRVYKNSAFMGDRLSRRTIFRGPST